MPRASRQSTTRFRRPPRLDDFYGRWLINRSDAVNLPKGAVLVIEEDPSSRDGAKFSLRLHQMLAGEDLSGPATFQDGYLIFTCNLQERRSWFCQTTVSLVEQGGQKAKFLFGIDLFGDPENAGVWGAEQDGP